MQNTKQIFQSAQFEDKIGKYYNGNVIVDAFRGVINTVKKSRLKVHGDETVINEYITFDEVSGFGEVFLKHFVWLMESNLLDVKPDTKDKIYFLSFGDTPAPISTYAGNIHKFATRMEGWEGTHTGRHAKAFKDIPDSVMKNVADTKFVIIAVVNKSNPDAWTVTNFIIGAPDSIDEDMYIANLESAFGTTNRS